MGTPEEKDQPLSREELLNIGISEDVEALLDEFQQAEELTPELVQRMVGVYRILTGAAKTLYVDCEVQYTEAVANYADETLSGKGSVFSPMNAKTISVEAARKLNELSEEWYSIEMYFENFDFIVCGAEVLTELVKFGGTLKFNMDACGGKKITKAVADVLLRRDNDKEPICLGVDKGAQLGDIAECNAVQTLRDAYSFNCIISDEFRVEGGSIFEDSTDSMREKISKTLS